MNEVVSQEVCVNVAEALFYSRSDHRGTQASYYEARTGHSNYGLVIVIVDWS
jgi:hypothetical protein